MQHFFLASNYFCVIFNPNQKLLYMKNLFLIALIIGMTITLTGCEPYYPGNQYIDSNYGDEAGEELISIYEQAVYTEGVSLFSEKNVDYIILGLETTSPEYDYRSTFLYIRFYNNYNSYSESPPSGYVTTLRSVAKAKQEIEFQNANTMGFDFSYTIQPAVLNGAPVWASKGKNNSYLLINTYDSDIRYNNWGQLWNDSYGWGVNYKFVSPTAFWVNKVGHQKAYNYQIRTTRTKSGKTEILVEIVKEMSYEDAKEQGFL